MHIFKIARALLIFFSCGYLTFRATTGLQKVNNGGIGVAVSSMTNKGDSKYPLYTFCPQWANSTHPEGLYDGKLTIEDIVSDKIRIQELARVESSVEDVNGSWTKSYQLVSIYSQKEIEGRLSPCFTYQRSSVYNSTLGDKVVFRINMSSFGDLQMAIHDDNGYIDTHFNVHGREETVFPTQILGDPINRIVKLEIKKEEIEVADKSQCKKQSEIDPYCLENIVENSLGCKIPWTLTSNQLPACSGRNSLIEILSIWPDGTSSSRSDLIRDLNDMNCMKSCIYYNYRPNKYYDKEFKAENNQLNQAYLELEITLNNKDLARHAEFFIYNWVDFMSEIGGYLGLFLGYALLSIVDFVENIWKNICKPEIKPADDEVLLPMRRQRRTNSPMLVPRRRVLLSPNHTAIGQKSNFG